MALTYVADVVYDLWTCLVICPILKNVDLRIDFSVDVDAVDGKYPKAPPSSMSMQLMAGSPMVFSSLPVESSVISMPMQPTTMGCYPKAFLLDLGVRLRVE